MQNEPHLDPVACEVPRDSRAPSGVFALRLRYNCGSCGYSAVATATVDELAIRSESPLAFTSCPDCGWRDRKAWRSWVASQLPAAIAVGGSLGLALSMLILFVAAAVVGPDASVPLSVLAAPLALLTIAVRLLAQMHRQLAARARVRFHDQVSSVAPGSTEQSSSPLQGSAGLAGW